MNQEWPTGRRRRLVVSSPDHLDEIMAHIRDQWHALVRADNLLGPRFAIAGVLNQIAVIEELCSSLRGQQRLAFVRLGAQYAESAAWLYEDAGHIEKARYWTGCAMELAYEGDDGRMVSTISEDWIWPTLRDRLGLVWVCREAVVITEG